MDFHALPRRDLQALCKRNAVRANMTNAAMADALRALPTVDGIEEYVKQTVAMPTPAAKPAAEEEPREKQGSLLPCGRRVTVKSPEPIRPEDGEKEDEDLKRDKDEEKAPALGVERRGPSRRDRAAPVVAPTTRRRSAAASKSEAGDVAVEAVPAPTTRRRIQSTVPMEAEEKVTRARRTSRRAAARKTGMQQEEEEEKVTSTRRTSRRAAARKTGMQQEEEEEKPQGVVSDVETVSALPVSDEGCDDPEEVEEATNPQNEEESVQEDEGETHAFVSDVESTVPAPVTDEVCDDAEDVEEATKPQNEEEDDVVEESSQEDEGVVMDTPTPVEEEPPVVEECKDKSAIQEPQVDVQQCAAPLPSQESPFRDGTGSGEAQLDEEIADAIHHASEEMEMVPVSELPQATLTAGETIKEVCFTGDAGHANEEENEVAAFSELLQHGKAETSEAGTEGFLCEEKEDVTVDEVLHDTVTGHDTILLDFSAKISRAVEEEGVVSIDEMTQSSMKTDEDGDEDDFDTDTCRADEQKDVVTVDNVSQVTVTNSEVVGYENVFSSDMPPELSSAGDLGDHITSPFIANMLDNVIHGEPTVSEEDVSKCMRSHGIEKRSTELVAVEEENEMKDENQNKEPLVLTKLSLRKLRAKLKETLIAHEEPLVSTKLSLRKLRAKLKETLIAHEGKEAKRVALAKLDNKSAIILTRRNN